MNGLTAASDITFPSALVSAAVTTPVQATADQMPAQSLQCDMAYRDVKFFGHALDAAPCGPRPDHCPTAPPGKLWPETLLQGPTYELNQKFELRSNMSIIVAMTHTQSAPPLPGRVTRSQSLKGSQDSENVSVLSDTAPPPGVGHSALSRANPG